ncbi:SPFH domain-containing protein [Patescibacteria group bacterium]|nr:SPFH domain-containing protein [Patescibacteria group bacterium]
MRQRAIDVGKFFWKAIKRGMTISYQFSRGGIKEVTRMKVKMIYIWLSVVIALFILALTLITVGIVIGDYGYLMTFFGALLLVLLAFWIRRCFRKVGSLESPARAVRVRWGKPRDVLEAGLHIIWWPVDDLVVYPTKQYLVDITCTKVHSKKDEKHDTALMTVELSVYFAWPGLKDEAYDLIESFKRAPTPAGGFAEDTELYTAFFTPTIDDAVRNVMATHNHEDCRQEKEKIEREIKDYLLDEEGNPFKEASLPKDKVDVAITQISFTEAMEQAFSAEEIGVKTGAGEKARRRANISALIEEGVPSLFAAMFMEKGEEKGFSSQELMFTALALRVFGIDFGNIGGTGVRISEEQERKLLDLIGLDKRNEFRQLLKEAGLDI